jgi:hypothetical protein
MRTGEGLLTKPIFGIISWFGSALYSIPDVLKGRLRAGVPAHFCLFTVLSIGSAKQEPTSGASLKSTGNSQPHGQVQSPLGR